MKIICLMENTSHVRDLTAEHGLCFYVETPKHKLLIDTGATAAFIDNTEKLGVDLTKVDTVFLSHGHYDHCGGVTAFAEINFAADIYISENAFDDYWLINDNRQKYIGIDRKIMALPQLKMVCGDLQIDSELLIFSKVKAEKLQPSTNRDLMKKLKLQDTDDSLTAKYVQDDFCHEQYLEVYADGKRIVFCGCAHKGIVNIMSSYKALRGVEPDCVISGFHTMNPNGYSEAEQGVIKNIAEELLQYKTIFYTCHCTGTEPSRMLKDAMKNSIAYIGVGDVVEF